jgi:putative RNA 2'-phosphotransferase
MDKNKLGTFMCYLLRHNPADFGLTPDEYGAVDFDAFALAVKSERKWQEVTPEILYDVVATCKKNRYDIVAGKIRARYGHSYPVTPLSPEERELPDYLYHGTNEEAMELIWNKQQGVKKMGRSYVHLSETTNFATLAATRRKSPLLILVDTKKAKLAGVPFTYVGDEVWLSGDIPFDCLAKPQSKETI